LKQVVTELQAVRHGSAPRFETMKSSRRGNPVKGAARNGHSATPLMGREKLQNRDAGARRFETSCK
jgi:hypothetical protein